jgi:hypothetical protein
MNVSFADTFYQDLDKVQQYLLDNDFDVSVINEIIDSAEERLEQFPNSGHIYKKDIRKILVLSKNIVFYRIIKNEVQVLHIKSGRQGKDI